MILDQRAGDTAPVRKQYSSEECVVAWSAHHSKMRGIHYVECDGALKKQIGAVMGDVAERHIRLDDGYAIVALDGQVPVGLIAVYRRGLPDPLQETDEGFINIIEVAESHRRRGIGRRLVEMSLERSRQEGR